MMPLLIADLIVTTALLVVLGMSWRHFYNCCCLARNGYKIAVIAHLALLASVVTRMVEIEAGVPWPARNGYPFAVLGRAGILLALAGVAMKRRQQKDSQKAKDSAEGVHNTLVATAVPPGQERVSR